MESVFGSMPWRQVTERRLDRLRTIKSRMVRLDTRVETVQALRPLNPVGSPA